MSSKRAIRRSACTGKIKYNSPSTAAMSAKKLGLSWYKCKFCAAYHVGHMPHRVKVASIMRMEDKS